MSQLGRTWLAFTALALVALPARGAIVDVGINNRRFVPPIVVIQPGDTVHWTNNDPQTMSHTVTSGPEGAPDGMFASGNLDPGMEFQFTFPAEGNFRYHCEYHGGMTGRVVVASGAVVRIQSFAFMPADVVINAGEKVTWVNLDTSPHTSTSDTALWDSGSIGQGLTFARSFPTSGRFPYHCNFHGSMLATVTVNGAAPTGACCGVSGCNETTAAGCAGTYRGDGTSCTPDPCAPPTGACCGVSGCSETTAAGCTGTYRGDGTSCTPDPCPPAPTGACCGASGCTVTTAAGCAGTYRGDGTSCTPDPCPPVGPITLRLIKDLATRLDVVFDWGTANPTELCKGLLATRPPALTCGPIAPTDPNVVTTPPSLAYQVQ